MRPNRLISDITRIMTQADLCRRRGDLQSAETLCQQALQLQPDNIHIMLCLGDIYLRSDQNEKACSVLQRATSLQPDRGALFYAFANALRCANRPNEAQQAYLRAIQLKPDYPEAYLFRGIVLQGLDYFSPAEDCFRKAIALRPGYAAAYCSLGMLLLAQNSTTDAEAALLKARELAPGDIGVLANLALFYEQSGRTDEAYDLAKQGLERAPEFAALHLTAAKCERRAGMTDKAMGRLQGLTMDTNTQPVVAADINYELGFLHDLTGNPDAAFEHAARANTQLAMLWEPRKPESTEFLERINTQSRLFTPSSTRLWSRSATPGSSIDPVFLIGFPRSGTTLLDKILDGHPDITTLEEKLTVPAVEQLMASFPGGYPGSIANLKPNQIAEARRCYFDAVHQYILPDAGQVLVDKMPLNTINTGLIWRIFPRARFIFALRHPCDVCLSCFRQNFYVTAGMAHFLSLEDTVNLYTKVMSAWLHYTSILPIEFHTVRYEDLVDNLEQEARKVIEFLDLGWQPEVMNYIDKARSKARVNTPSYTQVVKPIYRDARYRWRRYRKYLEPQMEKLLPFIELFGYGKQESA